MSLLRSRRPALFLHQDWWNDPVTPDADTTHQRRLLADRPQESLFWVCFLPVRGAGFTSAIYLAWIQKISVPLANCAGHLSWVWVLPTLLQSLPNMTWGKPKFTIPLGPSSAQDCCAGGKGFCVSSLCHFSEPKQFFFGGGRVIFLIAGIYVCYSEHVPCHDGLHHNPCPELWPDILSSSCTTEVENLVWSMSLQNADAGLYNGVFFP